MKTEIPVVELREFKIYKLTSPSGKSYVGQTCNLRNRFYGHRSSSNRCVAIANSIKKYGFDSFLKEVIADNLTIDEANNLESFFINAFNTMAPNGYNLREGGANGRMSQESKEKIRKGLINRPVSAETREKIGNANRGLVRSADVVMRHRDAITGRKHSQEHKDKISASAMGHCVSKLTREKISASNTGYITSEHTKKRLSDINAGEKHPRAKRWVLIDPFGNEHHALSLTEICKENGLSASLIARAAKTSYKHKGWKSFILDDFIETINGGVS
jgi:group I intron endonuclease